jgi:3-phosphoglycerate kinase
MKPNKYKERLFKEWLQHGKIIIAVDFDSTISPYHTIDNIEDIEKVIETIKNAKYTGAYITI